MKRKLTMGDWHMGITRPKDKSNCQTTDIEERCKFYNTIFDWNREFPRPKGEGNYSANHIKE